VPRSGSPRRKGPAAPQGPDGPGSSTPWTANLRGPGGQLFGDPAPSPDETAFQVDNTSDAYYKSPYYAQHQNDIETVPMGPPGAPLDLQDVVGASFLAPITGGGKISFHAVGDTGASVVAKISSEASVADAMARDLQGPPVADAPAFLFHLGDVVYNFGEADYYYDQFYEPFREYDRPIFAIPGNHDGAVTYTNGGSTPDVPSLQAFIANFCASAPGKPLDAGGLARTTMTQPGVYFTLDAPFVSIVGLYTNVLEGPGVITDQRGAYPALANDGQYDWLVSELKRLAPQRASLERAVVLACHHPPVSADLTHGGATGLAADLDRAFAAAGLWPDVVLSGHAHIYQRFERDLNNRKIPYVVAGSGGHNALVPPGELAGEAPRTWNDYTLVTGPTAEYGYLTVTVDMRNPSARTLEIAFTASTDPTAADQVTVTLS
jgi:3',5'-cyclic AMP phosphodiesterase CpdA